MSIHPPQPFFHASANPHRACHTHDMGRFIDWFRLLLLLHSLFPLISNLIPSIYLLFALTLVSQLIITSYSRNRPVGPADMFLLKVCPSHSQTVSCCFLARFWRNRSNLIEGIHVRAGASNFLFSDVPIWRGICIPWFRILTVEVLDRSSLFIDKCKLVQMLP